MSEATKKFLADVTERMAKTFFQGFVLAWLVFQDGQWDALISMDNLKAGIAGGVLSLATSLASKKVGSPNTAAALPAAPDTDQG